MSVRFLAEGIWDEITAAVKGRRGKAFVAVPYFGKAGCSLLPLEEEDTLVVNASEAAVRSGQTYPQGLRKLLDEGVDLYTLDSLHAKIYVLGAVAFIGSANASSNSSEVLKEAVVKVRDPEVVTEARRHIQRLCVTPLLRRDLDRLARKYRPPRYSGGGRRAATSARPASPRMFLAQLYEAEIEDEFKKDLRTGEQKAKAKRQKKGSIVETVWRRELPYRMGDTLIQVQESASGAILIYPRAKVIDRKVVPRGSRKMTFVFLERFDRSGRRLATVAKKLPRKYRDQLLKQGPIPDNDFRARLLEIVG